MIARDASEAAGSTVPSPVDARLPRGVTEASEFGGPGEGGPHVGRTLPAARWSFLT
jgi:hypothetical protein